MAPFIWPGQFLPPPPSRFNFAHSTVVEVGRRSAATICHCYVKTCKHVLEKQLRWRKGGESIENLCDFYSRNLCSRIKERDVPSSGVVSAAVNNPLVKRHRWNDAFALSPRQVIIQISAIPRNEIRIRLLSSKRPRSN